MHLADDFGWANAGWHRPEGFNEVQTPVMDGLVKSGIELDRAYSYQFCSPTRSALQSGRLPTHVNTKNLGTGVWNPADPVSGFSGIPRNMTGMATVMKRAGYATHQAGKWDAGMATPDHTPFGRGYMTSLNYFCHANDYWDEMCGGGLVDLWDTTHPGFGENGSCLAYYNGSHGCHQPGGNPGYTTGPEELYEEHKLVTRVLETIEAHDPETPLFFNYDSHIVHSPLQVPQPYFDKFSFIQNASTPDWDYHRHLYTSMVNYLDTGVGKIVEALKTKGMWENTIWVFQSDNGGPSFTGDNHTANNFPLRGAKYSNWEGGIRVNAFVSGGYLAKVAPARIGTKLEGLVSIADWYATFAAIAGQDPTDHRAAAAGLPPIDGVDQWPYLTGKAAASPRTDIFADHAVLIKGNFKVMQGSAESTGNPTCPKGPGNPDGSLACVKAACWAGPYYPNASVPNPACAYTEFCAKGACLYNIFEDPEERNNLSDDPQHQSVLSEMLQALAAYQAGEFQPNRTGGNPQLAASVGHTKYRGFWGKFLP